MFIKQTLRTKKTHRLDKRKIKRYSLIERNINLRDQEKIDYYPVKG